MIPLFTVRDIYKSREFYKDTLDFELVSENHVWIESGVLRWCMVQSGDSKLMFILEEPDYANPREFHDPTVYYFYPENTRTLHAILRSKGYDVSEIFTTPRGTIEFTMLDPDGRRLVFEGHTEITPSMN